MNTTLFTCPHCSKDFGIQSSWLGQSVSCPLCQETVDLPAEDSADETAAPPGAPTPFEAVSSNLMPPPLGSTSSEPPAPPVSAPPSSLGSVAGPPPIAVPSTAPDQPPDQGQTPEGEAAIVISTEDGTQVALREPVPTVSDGEYEHELYRLSPEERAQRRFRRNVILWTMGATLLLATLALLLWLGPM